MGNTCLNKVIIKHDDFSKVRVLYRFISGNFKLYPSELCDQRNIKDTDYNLKEFNIHNLKDLIFKGWIERRGLDPWSVEKVLSEKGEFLMLEFDTSTTPPIEIYEELERQGFHVRSYFFSPYSCFCGCFINGIGEWYAMYDAKDLPQDIDRMLGVDEFNKAYHSEEGREYPDKCNDEDAEGQCHMC